MILTNQPFLHQMQLNTFIPLREPTDSLGKLTISVDVLFWYLYSGLNNSWINDILASNHIIAQHAIPVVLCGPLSREEFKGSQHIENIFVEMNRKWRHNWERIIAGYSDLEMWVIYLKLEKDLFDKIHFCTKYNNSQSRLLIRQETLIKVHMHRLHKGHQRSKQVYHAVSLFSFSVLPALKFGDENAVMVPMIVFKKYFELTGPVDNETESTCDGRYNCQHFHRLFCGLDRFKCRIIHAEDNYCIWILHTESGIDYIVCEL